MRTSRGITIKLLGDRHQLKGWFLCVTVFLSFSAGSAFTRRLTHVERAKADSNRVFELLIYHTLPGKAPALEMVFRDVAKLQDKHNLNVIGYWVPNEDPAWANTFVYLIAHPSREAANKNSDALHADPGFEDLRGRAIPLVERVNGEYRVDEVYMRPADYSAMK